MNAEVSSGSREFAEWQSGIQVTAWMFLSPSTKQTVTEHGRSLKTQELETRVLVSLLSSSRAISIIVGSRI